MTRGDVTCPTRHDLWLLGLGLVPYGWAWNLQHRLVDARRKDELPDLLMLLEHEPVITLGRRADPSHILASEEQLSVLGVEVHQVERGGDVTYHGPGQLVGYPILRVADHGLGASDYMHLLEDILIRTLAEYRLVATRRKGTIGLWIGPDKIAALGARIQSGVTYHGFALNVNTNLEHFQLIVPCGLRDGGVTSMSRELGHRIELPQVGRTVARHLAGALSARLTPVTLRELEEKRVTQVATDRTAAPVHTAP